MYIIYIYNIYIYIYIIYIFQSKEIKKKKILRTIFCCLFKESSASAIYGMEMLIINAECAI